MKLHAKPANGFTLVELIMFIVIVSVGLAGILLAINQSVLNSPDPQIRKQAVAIAQALLEEVQLQPYTFCDPNDTPAVYTATNTAGCTAGQAQTVPTPNSESRGSVTDPLDNVIDYHNLSISPVTGYTALVTVAAATLGNITAASGDALLITVTVTGPNGIPVVLQGYRARYAPNDV